MGTPVLVVEDDPDIRSTLQMALADEGYTALEARDGQEALAKLRASQTPMVVILDYLLPLLDGGGILRQVAVDPSLARHAYLCMTARFRLPDPEAERLLDDLHAPLFFKPFELDAMLEAVAQAAQRLETVK